MKKKNIIIGITTVVIVMISAYLLTRPKILGNLNHSYTEQSTSTSEISFSGETGDKIKFVFSSNIKNGDLDMVLYDSDGNMIYQLDKAKKLVAYFTLDNSDIYTLTAKRSNFIGNNKIVS
ncbi:hypothetical protein BLA28_10685 [Eisenbergiella tayi]|uniref:hypothetical protein n=1 Tax=Eisenbergiella tayi TaxID=1432052 RepID=UPI0008FD72AA|nr:hypothetical protein [Eisenbergiella tayi]OIZ65202.1 hypothetical protein BLA28_10685 [Eisenbergiella tayi]